MEAYETFVSDPSKVPEILEELREMGIPASFNKKWLKQLPADQPISDLYIHLFKRIGLVDEDLVPIEEHYEQFVGTEEESRSVISDLVNESYEEVFKRDPKAHQLPDDKMEEIFHELIGDKKSDTVIELVAQTFKGLINYAHDNFEPAQNELVEKEEVLSEKSEEKKAVLTFDAPPESLDNFEVVANGHSSNGIHSDDKEELPDTEESEPELNDTMEEPSTPSESPEQVSKSYEEETSDSEAIRDTMTQNNTIKQHLNGEIDASKSSFLKKALLRRARLHDRLNNHGEATRAYRDIIKYARDGKIEIEEDMLTEAYYKCASLLEKQERFEEAAQIYDRFVEKFG